jgi:bacillithiol biosynthesis cysteine-adding enzyme BshC
VPPDSAVSSPAPADLLHLDIRRFPWIRRLAADYAFDYPRLESFFSGNPDDDSAWTSAIARVRAHPRPSQEVADLVSAQLQRRGAPAEALAAAQALRDPQTVAIVTGQQAGLFGGPLFTLLKAMTALAVAGEVSRRHGVQAVAIFWIDAEDHDWDEVKVCGLLDGDLNPAPVGAGTPDGAGIRAVGHVTLDAAIDEALTALERTLTPSEFTTDLLADLRRAYRPGTTMADAFGAMLDVTLGTRGLVVYNASDPAAKPLVAELFAAELARAGETSRLARQAGDALTARGYHAQVAPPEDAVSLFALRDGVRQPIRVAGTGTFLVGDAARSRDDLVAHARQAPAEFSPNVLLRPLVQDTIFPTVCYIAGPSELAYLAQLKEVYASFGLPMPLVRHRASATIVDSNTMRFLTRHALPLEALRARDEAALNTLLSAQLPPEVDDTIASLAATIDERMERLARAVVAVDATLEGATRSTQGRMQDDLQRLQGKVVQAAKRKDATLRRQFQHAQQQIFPGGEPQERQLGFVYFLNRYGPHLIERLAAALPGEQGTHSVLTV